MPAYSLDNPLAQPNPAAAVPSAPATSIYERAVELGQELLEKPLAGGGIDRVLTQHSKGRMTVWERIKVLTDSEPNLLFHNWGRELDGASIVTGILNIKGRDVAVYGHDF